MEQNTSTLDQKLTRTLSIWRKTGVYILNHSKIASSTLKLPHISNELIPLY